MSLRHHAIAETGQRILDPFMVTPAGWLAEGARGMVVRAPRSQGLDRLTMRARRGPQEVVEIPPLHGGYSTTYVPAIPVSALWESA